MWWGLILWGCAAAPLFEMSPADVDACLADLHGRGMPFEARLEALARQGLGTPYVGGPLGEGPGARYDTDPLIDLARVDCTTFVEQVIALAASRTYDDAVQCLQRIRYKDGVIDYEARNHFMVTDWLANNGFCRDVTWNLGVPTDSVTRTISRRAFFADNQAPELGRTTPDQTVTLEYVPARLTAAAEKALPSPALLCFVGKLDWLFVIHCGLYIRGEDGVGRLIHAPKKEGRVVSQDLAAYVNGSDRILGFIAHRIEDPRASQETPQRP